jgi:hypothetical protein
MIITKYIGNLIYSADVKITGMTDFGISMESSASGDIPIPLVGAKG